MFETCHPLNRGESVKANTLSYRDSLGIVVQLDKRSQGDANRDFMNMISWQSDQGSVNNRTCFGINSSNVSKINVGVGFTISGKMKNEENFVLVGDHAKISAEANPKSIEGDSSLNRWGFKARTVPIFGYESSILVSSNSSDMTDVN